MIKQEFNVGDEFIYRLNGGSGYVVLAFKGCIVKLSEREGRLLPLEPHNQRYLASDEKDPHDHTRLPNREVFERGERVTIVASGKKGKVLDIKQFYVVQLGNGQISVLIQEVMAKSTEKIISPIPPGLMQEGGPLIFPRRN